MSMKDEGSGDELETVSFQPLPNIITAFSADASPFEALSESVDNAIDHIRSRAYDGYPPEDDLEINITFEAGKSLAESRIIVDDNAGGVSAENLSRFFQWGASDTAPESIGRFGVGASRIAALGDIIEYQSREVGQATGYGFEVNVAEMEEYEGEVTEDTYQAQRKRLDDLCEGHTRIIIKDLERSFIEIFNIEPDQSEEKETYDERSEVPDQKWDKAIKKLSNKFGDYFERYITEGIEFDADYFPEGVPGVDVSINVKLEFPDETFEDTASPPPAIEYSYLPFDSLGPRRYTGIPFDENDSTSPEAAAIRADIEVGLMLQADDEKAGLTLYANDRKILSRDTANPLFSSDYLGRYRSESGHSRLVVEVELRGEISEMPINSLKSDLDMNSPISDPLLRIAKNAAKRYRKQTYSSLPTWMLSVYDINNSFASNGGEIKRFDKSSSRTNSARFRKQPGNSGRRMFPERDRLRSIVKVHRTLRIQDKSPLRPHEEPAYENYFESNYPQYLDDNEFALPEPAEVTGPDIAWAEIGITRDDNNLKVVKWIRKIAELHVDSGGRADETTELFEWQIPRYREEIRRQTAQTTREERELIVWEEIPEKVLIRTLSILAEELEGVPSRGDLEDYWANPIVFEDRFGSWENALEAAGLSEDSDGKEDEGTDSDSDVGQEEDTETQFSDEDSVPSEEKTGTSGQTTDDDETQQPEAAENQSFDGSGIVIAGDYYEIPAEDQDLVDEVLDLADGTEPEDAWRQLKEILEWYQQMPSK